MSFTQDAITYDRYDITVDYVVDEGVRQAPVADMSGTSRMLRVHGGMAKKRIKFLVGRFTQKPDIPHPSPKDPNLVLLSWRISPVAPSLQADGLTKLYAVEGEYLYGMKKKPAPASELRGVAPPTENAPIDIHKLEVGQYRHGII